MRGSVEQQGKRVLDRENSTANASPADVDVAFSHSQLSGTERLMPFLARSLASTSMPPTHAAHRHASFRSTETLHE